MTYGQANADNWAGAGATGSSSPTYSVGGSVSGLSGTVVLRDNGGDDLTRDRQRPLHLRDQARRRRRLQRHRQDEPQRPELQRRQRQRHDRRRRRHATWPSAARATPAPRSDDFNRPNGSLGSNWVAMSDGALSISSQAVLGTSATAGDIRTAETYPATSPPRSSSPRRSSRAASGSARRPRQNGGQDTYLGIYFWNNGSQQLRLYKRNAGTWIQLGNSYNSGPLAGRTNSTERRRLDDLLPAGRRHADPATDASMTGGAPGIMTYGPANADNWTGAGATGTHPPTRSAGPSLGSRGRSCSATMAVMI